MRQKEKDQLDRFDLEWMMSTAQGRRIVWRLLTYCGIYKDIEGEGTEAFRQIGRRQVGLYLLGLVSDSSEKELFIMMQEARNRAIEEQIEYDNTNDSDTSGNYAGSSTPINTSGGAKLSSFLDIDSGDSCPDI